MADIAHSALGQVGVDRVTCQPIISRIRICAAVQNIGAIAADQNIIPCFTAQGIDASSAIQCVIAGAAAYAVCTCGTHENVMTGTGPRIGAHKGIRKVRSDNTFNIRIAVTCRIAGAVIDRV